MAENKDTPKGVDESSTYREGSIDRIERLSHQLYTLLDSFIGEGWEGFSGWDSGRQHDLLWTAASMARDLRDTINTTKLRAVVDRHMEVTHG